MSVLYKVISLLLALNTLFFISREVEFLKFLKITNNTTAFYFVYFILSIFILFNIFTKTKKLSFKIISTNLKKLLFIYLPTEILLILALFQSDQFHIVIQFLVGFYFLVGSLYFIFNYHYKVETRQCLVSTKPTKLHLLIVFIIFIINLSFGLYNIEKSINVDEPLWMFERVPRYFKNLAELELADTQVSDKPGITVSIISGIGLFFENPKKYEDIHEKNYNYYLNKNFSTKDPLKIENLNKALRTPIVIFSSLSLFIFYFLLTKILKPLPALLSLMFLGLSPVLIGMSRIINPDSLLWIFSTLSLLAYFAHLKQKQKKYLYFTGVFLGFALLTKYVANILYIFFFALVFLDYFCCTNRNNKLNQYFKNKFTDLAIIVLVSLITFYLLLPATWIAPKILFTSTIFSQAFSKIWILFIFILGFVIADIVILKNKFLTFIFANLAKKQVLIFKLVYLVFLFAILLVILNTYFGMPWFDFETTLATAKSSYRDINILGFFLTHFYPLVFGIHPLILISVLAFVVIKLSFHGRDEAMPRLYREYNYLVFYFVLFILIYYLGSTVNHVASIIRYQIMLYPVILILGGISLAYWIEYLNCRDTRFYVSTKKYSLLYIILIIISTYSLYQTFPFYYSYSSSLLPKNYHTDIKDMGAGSYEAAEYLNSLPNAKNLGIWTDKNGICQVFVGECHSSFSFDKLKNKKIDYIVVSSGRKNRIDKQLDIAIRHQKPDIIYFNEYYEKNNPVKAFYINGRKSQYVKIYNR